MTEVCKRFLPDHVLDCKSSLVSALAGAFGVSEDDLQLQVRDLCITPDRELQDAIALWLDQYHLTWKQSFGSGLFYDSDKGRADHEV